MHDVNLSYGSLRARDISSTINLKTFTGDGKAVVFYQGKKRNLEVPLEFSLFNSKFSEGKKTPETFSLKLSSSGTKGSFFFKNFPFTVTLEKNQDVTSFSSSKNLGLTGFVKNTGEVFASVAKDKPCRFTLAGKIFEQNIDLAVSDVFVDLHELTSFFNLEFLKIYKGIMQGSFKIAGLRGDPYFNGELFVTNADWSLPSIVPSHITKDKFNIILEHNQITMPEVLMKVRNDYCNIGMTVFMDRWFLSNVKGFVRTPPGKVAPAALDIKVAKFDGMTSVDLDILYESGIMDVTGTVYVENVKATVRANEIIEVLNNGIGLPFDIRTNLKITAGTHVNVVLDPLLRCVLVPGTSAVFKLDQSDGSYSLDGDVRLKSGDITYFNRNFYLKEGVIRSNDNEGTFNPRITVRAETRERDNDGRDVRIILSADNQTIFPVESFVPKISTIPAKSEAEIRTLLGQIAVGDVSSASDMLLMAGDYAIQSMLLRNLENSLREIFNFDIFSVRTMMLQNIVKQGVAGNVLQQDFTVGNLFDNSTVYIGKYFGSVIYADASMHVSYDESRWNDPSDKLRGISFRPEFGLELEAPFTNIRWSFSPDISAMTNGVFMPATSLTLSWRFSF
ncbi:MAG: translocation/assembly module TamB domain-containing protein [Treponema sp.]|nr:translocation/assembly module TamB domain-containing protein [Treponema sp.]